MKKLMTVLICACLLLSAVGCGSGGHGPTTEAATANTGKEEAPGRFRGLEIYYLNELPYCTARNIVMGYSRAYPGVNVNAVAFDNLEEMDRRIREKLEAGEGPDVILFPDSTTVDTARLAMNDLLLDLSGMLEEDPEFRREDYYPVLDAGIINGGQYLMPLRMQVMYLMTTQERFTGQLALPEDYSLEELMEALLENAEDCTGEYSAMSTMHSFDTYLYDLLRLTGVEILDLDRLSPVLSQETLLDYSVFGSVAYSQCLKAEMQMREYGPDNVGEMLRRNTAVLSDQSLPVTLRYFAWIYSKGLDEEMRLLAYPGKTDPEAVTADVSLYAAVVKTTEEPYDAYRFVRYAMDNGFGNFNEQMPVNRQEVEGLLATLRENTGKTVVVGTRAVLIDKMSGEQEQQCRAILDRITRGSIANAGLAKIFADTMGGCIRGETDFDSSNAGLQEELRRYLEEIYQ